MISSGKRNTRQPSLPSLCPLEDAIRYLADAGAEERGAVFTRREVVEFILDLIAYIPEKPLFEKTLLEPSCGNGDFLLIAIGRLLVSWRKFGSSSGNVYETLKNSIRAIELHPDTYDSIWASVIDFLTDNGISVDVAGRLADAWLIKGDFLLTPLDLEFDFVAGNPPYVRHELIPNTLIAVYRSYYETIYDRADLYVPFMERSLKLLRNGGVLGFICADRWTKNKYGAHLRKMIADGFSLRIYVDMIGTPAFHDEVTAYPAVTIIAREKPGVTRVASRPEITGDILRKLATALAAENLPSDNLVKEVADVVVGSEPWILESSDQLQIVRRLEQIFPTIEDAGCKIGIGVATGADKAFIGPFDELDVETDRKLPIVMTRDILDGEVRWRGLGIVNPFADGSGLVDLEEFPRLKRYLEDRRDQIHKRHVARKAPNNWYRTIDRIYPDLAKRPKLLIPDIKGEAHIVYENGRLYPHHNLYFITSDEWDLKALQAVLQSGIAKLFVSIYSTRMRGGYLRFQAQYLRRIRLPHWQSVSQDHKSALLSAIENVDKGARDSAVFDLYGLTPGERAKLNGNG